MVTATNAKLPTGGWAYGDAGDRWAVQVGDIWEAGPALLGCGDLQKGAGLELFTGRSIDLFYADPPWDPGNARSFRTKAGLPSGAVDFPDLLTRVVEVAKLTTGDVYLEMGKRYADKLAELVASKGGVQVGRWSITYYRKNPMVLFQFDFGKGERGTLISSAEGMDDENTPTWAIERSTEPGDTVADCCTGRGLTCRSAVQAGRKFIGTELNPRRLAVVVDWLAQNGYQPKKVGELTSMRSA